MYCVISQMVWGYPLISWVCPRLVSFFSTDSGNSKLIALSFVKFLSVNSTQSEMQFIPISSSYILLKLKSSLMLHVRNFLLIICGPIIYGFSFEIKKRLVYLSNSESSVGRGYLIRLTPCLNWPASFWPAVTPSKTAADWEPQRKLANWIL
jgi:hypothetical protein